MDDVYNANNNRPVMNINLKEISTNDCLREEITRHHLTVIAKAICDSMSESQMQNPELIESMAYLENILGLSITKLTLDI
jgi:hypothetical protein